MTESDKPTTTTTTTAPNIDVLHDETVRRAVNLSWNNQVEETEALLRPTAATIPRHSLHLAELHWCASLISGNEKLMLQVLEQLNGTLKLTESYLKNFPALCIKNGLLRADSSPDRVQDVQDDLNIVLADTNLLSAGIMVLTSKKVTGAWRVRQAWSIYNKLANRKKRPICKELEGSVAFGCGLIMFGISWLPAVMISICRVVGFQSDRIRGLALLQDACNEHGVRSPLASLVLLVFSLIVPHSLSNLDELLRVAKPVVDESLRQWPKGMMFNWLASYYTKKIGDVPNTLKHVDAAIEACMATGKFESPPATLAIDRVSCLFLAQQFEEASRAINELMAHDGGTCIVRGVCYTYQALCYHMIGKKKEAAAVFQSVKSLKCHTKDRLFIDMGLNALKTRKSGLTLIPYEVMYVKRDVAHMVPETAQSFLTLIERDFQPFLSSANTEEKAVYDLIRGILRRIIGQKEEGFKEIKAAADAATAGKGFKVEKFVAPFACCEVAEIYYKDNKLDDCLRYLELANKFGGGPYEDFIKPRVRIGRETINARIANGGKEPPVASHDVSFASPVEEGESTTTTTTTTEADESAEIEVSVEKAEEEDEE